VPVAQLSEGRRQSEVPHANRGGPSLGHTTRLRVFIDPDLWGWLEVWAAAGTRHDVFGIVERLGSGVICSVECTFCAGCGREMEHRARPAAVNSCLDGAGRLLEPRQ
jgi:hypothetical protein